MNKFFSNIRRKTSSGIRNNPIGIIVSIIQTKLFFGCLPLKNQILFIKQLAILIRAGVPLLSSLHMLKKQSRSGTLTTILNCVIGDVENGQYLGTALGKFKNIFGELTINIIAVGEISGNLSDNLDHLALSLKKKQALLRKIISASVYPIFIVIATLAITVMLTIFLFPKIIPIFKSVDYDLPWTTKFLIATTNLFQNHGVLIFILGIIIAIGTWLLLKVKKIHFWYDRMLILAPLIRRLVQTYNTANICRTMGLLINSEVTVVRAFHITSNTIPNLAYKQELRVMADTIAQGELISASIHKNPKLFPLML